MKAKDKFSIKFPEVPRLDDINLEKYPAIRHNWIHSRNVLNELSQKLITEFGEDKHFSVLAAGSYGRMDANERSDLDFFIIHDGNITEQSGSEKVAFIRKVAEEMNLAMPNPKGAFSKPVYIDDLMVKVGSNDDSLHLMAQRLLILMECRAIYNADYFKTITGSLLRHYLKLVEEESNKEAVVLLNDLIRYFRAICLNVEFSFWEDESTKWGLRNVKLGHSRILIYAGLLLLIMNSSKQPKKVAYIQNNIELTPLERIGSVYKDNKDYNFERVVGAYNNFLFKLSQDEVRKSLQELGYDKRYDNNYYAELKINSQFLQSELTRFILQNKRKWSSKVFEYLIF